MSLRYIDGDGNEKFIAGGGGGSADIIPLTEAEFKDKYEKGELEEGKYYAITNDVDPDSIEQQLINLGTQLNGIEAIVKADGETLPVGSGTIFGAVKALDDKIDDANQKLDEINNPIFYEDIKANKSVNIPTTHRTYMMIVAKGSSSDASLYFVYLPNGTSISLIKLYGNSNADALATLTPSPVNTAPYIAFKINDTSIGARVRIVKI